MNATQSICYYAIEIIGSVVILAVLLFAAVMAGGALSDRYRRIFGTPSLACVAPVPAISKDNNR